jgi:hypothetical protein
VVFRCTHSGEGHFINTFLAVENNMRDYLMKGHDVLRSRRNNVEKIKGKIIPVFEAFSDVVEDL